MTTFQQTLSVLRYAPGRSADSVDHQLDSSGARSSDADMAASSNARLFDPLWFMTRQWQMGEFQAEDTGSPVQARVRATNAMLSRLVLGELSASENPAAATIRGVCHSARSSNGCACAR